MMTFNKRQKSHWNQGKVYKGTRKAKEKVWVESEIVDQIYGDDYRYSKRTRNYKASAEYQLKWYREAVARYENYKILSSWQQDFLNHCRDQIRKKEKILNEN